MKNKDDVFVKFWCSNGHELFIKASHDQHLGILIKAMCPKCTECEDERVMRESSHSFSRPENVVEADPRNLIWISHL